MRRPAGQYAESNKFQFVIPLICPYLCNFPTAPGICHMQKVARRHAAVVEPARCYLTLDSWVECSLLVVVQAGALSTAGEEFFVAAVVVVVAGFEDFGDVTFGPGA